MPKRYMSSNAREALTGIAVSLVAMLLLVTLLLAVLLLVGVRVGATIAASAYFCTVVAAFGPVGQLVYMSFFDKSHERGSRILGPGE
jgi:hypothetical protein